MRILARGHPKSMNAWLAKHITQNRNKSCWLTEIYFINSINCDKIIPCRSWSLLFASKRDLSCLFSSQAPLPFFEDITKFAEVHQVFCKHDWLHEIKLRDLKRSTTWSSSRLFSCVIKYAERRRDRELPSTTKSTIFIISWNRMKARTCYEV